MAQSKKLNEMIALAVDTAAMKGKFKRRHVIDDLMAHGSIEIAAGAAALAPKPTRADSAARR